MNAPLPDDRVNMKLSLGFEQRQRASALDESVNDDTLAAAYEIIYLRDRLKFITEWLERHQPDVFRRGLWEAIGALENPRD